MTISPLADAIQQLQKSLEYYHSDLVQADPELVVQLRAAAIQAFQFTYELCWKMLKRHLKMTQANPADIDTMSFPDLIRLGCDQNLILSDVQQWKRYRQERGTTSHTYDENKAQEIFLQLPEFLNDAKYLYEQLEKRI